MAASARYPSPDPLAMADLRDRTYLVTGATSGLGKEVAEILGGCGATVYVVCRGGQARANAAAAAVRAASAAASGRAGEVHGLAGDVGLASDVRRVSRQSERENEKRKITRAPWMSALVCAHAEGREAARHPTRRHSRHHVTSQHFGILANWGYPFSLHPMALGRPPA